MVPAKAMPSKKLWLGFLYKGKLHMDLGEFKLAEACFRKITTLDPGSTSGWVYLANSLAKQERFAEACQVSKLGLKAKGDIDEVYFNLGLNKQALGKYKEARRCFEKALELDPQYKEAKRACKDLELLERALKQLKMK